MILRVSGHNLTILNNSYVLQILDAVNFQSLNLVRDELISTIDATALYLNDFQAAEDKEMVLQECCHGIRQIIGIFKIIEFHGAEQLSRELLATIERLDPAAEASENQRLLEVTCNSFVVLTRYVEYVQESQTRLPMLLIPIINELRMLRGEMGLPESNFFNIDLLELPAPPSVDHIVLQGDKFVSGIRRIRHLYQIGLVGLIKETQMESSVLMMRRALDRCVRICHQGQPMATLWWLADLTLGALIEQKINFITSRKMLFGLIDRMIRDVERNGQAAFDVRPPRAIIKELVYLINLSNHDSDQVRRVRENYRIEPFPFTDEELTRQRSLLQGPNRETVSQLTELLGKDLANAKESIEKASLSNPHEIEDLEGFIGSLNRLVETLKLVGLEDACKAIRKIRQKVNRWFVLQEIDPQELEEVANTFLYIDTAIENVANIEIVDGRVATPDADTEKNLIASNLLSEAKQIAISEVNVTLARIKGDIEAFDKSGFDAKHIEDIDRRLTRASAAVAMLELAHASCILSRCSQFVRDAFGDDDQIDAKLEAFADAIISVEYYLNSADNNFGMDKSVLRLAEESLDNFGYPKPESSPMSCSEEDLQA